MNRQLRTFVFLLYCDNKNHMNAIDKLSNMDNSLFIKHISKGENKEHFHCILKYDNPTWLKSVINDLGLDYDTDNHLFHSFKDFKDKENKSVFKSLEDYISYLDHQENDNKEDKYSIDDFQGGLIDLARKVINNREKPQYERLIDLCNFIQEYKLENPFERYSFIEWYKICYRNGYGELFYKNWYKMRDILKPYLWD